MDILIKGMEMPKHCIDCPFMVSRDGDDCILQSDDANASFGNWEQMKAGCPLAPVPPHGRLIDADALRAFAYQRQKETGIACCVDALDISLAPTIIPAEDGEIPICTKASPASMGIYKQAEEGET